MNLRAAKKALRQQVRAGRDAIPPAERARRSLAIAERVLALAEISAAETVMAFASFGSEVDTRPLLERLAAEGRTVLLPRVEEREIVPVRWTPGMPLWRSAFGIDEPKGEPVDPAGIDLVITPGVAFDRSGRRTGYGGGFYDRLFGRLRPGVPRIAVAFGIQIVDEVPSGGADRAVDAIVTESEVIRPALAG